MKTFITLAFTICVFSATAQVTVYWKGGMPGNESNWFIANNWSNFQVPNEYSHVVIPPVTSGHNATPVIDDYAEAASVHIQSGASLTVADGGELFIDGNQTFTYGIRSDGGFLVNNGKISLNRITFSPAGYFLHNLQGSGVIFIDGVRLDNDTAAKK